MNFKELKKEIFNEFPYRIELHAHSRPASACSDVEPEELVDIYHKAGYHALALTNHFLPKLMERGGIDLFLEDYERAAKHAAQYGMRVYLCAELRFEECVNDYLLYGVDRKILETAAKYFDKGLAAYVNEGKEERTLLVHAHPFRKNMVPVDPVLTEGVEAFNLHAKHNAAPATALKYAVQNGKEVLLSGTDYHHPSMQSPAVAMRVRELPEDSFALAAQLRSGDFCYEMENRTIVLP